MKATLKAIYRAGNQSLDRFRHRGIYTRLHRNTDLDLHIREAVEWIKRAQDSGSDRGVAYGTRFGADFDVSYPETTGYIIQTFVELARQTGDNEYLERARAMADWEVSIQMDSGAVMGGKLNPNPSPAIFNTGQVLLGWAALYRHTRDPRYSSAGCRAGEWMLEMQEPNGHWVRGNSRFVNPVSTLYNVKAAWGLAEMGRAADEPRFVEGASRNATYTLSRQQKNGWFAECCLTDPANPLLHTIAYTMQGLLGIGKITGRSDLIDAAARCADGLLALMDPEGFLPGRIDANWRGATAWCCLTGSAQTSIVWSELFELTGKTAYRDAARKINRYLMCRHDISSPSPSIRGGLAGSWPVWGDYGKFLVLNWATKFFIDALLLEKHLTGTGEK